ncbi:MAG: hypothetical protein KY440_07910 [Actinobacteria bacterium]|nr:hypothetical protein [Actinomycetota bacterium]
MSLDRDSGVILETPSAAPPSAAPVMPSPPTLSEEEQILAQYRRFFASSTTLSTLPAAERPALLREIATDPQYTRTLDGLAAADAAGEINYGGQGGVSPRVANIGLATAVVQDCQDGSQTGRARKSDGTKLTVGLPAELAVTQMRRGPDGIWRVAEVIYPPDRTC